MHERRVSERFSPRRVGGRILLLVLAIRCCVVDLISITPPYTRRRCARRRSGAQLLGEMLRFDERPNLIALHALGGSVANVFIQILRAGRADVFQQPGDCVLNNAPHADC